MHNIAKSIPQIPLFLASLVLLASFVWAFPADAPNAAAGGEAVAADPWAGVSVSDAYAYAECLRCGEENEVRTKSCSRCGYEFPQPSALMTDPSYVFVPGRGYYPEGTLLEPGKPRTGLIITGVILTGAGLGTLIALSAITSDWESPGITIAFFVPAIASLGTGIALAAVGLGTRSKPVYALERGAGPRAVAARKLYGSLAVEVKVELPMLCL